MSNTIFGFENLAAYQRAMDLVDKVYDIMKGFPTEERYAICDQFRDLAESIEAIARPLSGLRNSLTPHCNATLSKREP